MRKGWTTAIAIISITSVLGIVTTLGVIAMSPIWQQNIHEFFNPFTVEGPGDEVEVCFGRSETIRWSFSNLHECTDASYEITLPNGTKISGSSNNSVEVTTNQAHPVGEYTYSISAQCGSHSDTDSVKLIVLSNSSGACDDSGTVIPGFEIVIFAGTSFSLGAIVIVIFHTKFRKQKASERKFKS